MPSVCNAKLKKVICCCVHQWCMIDYRPSLMLWQLKRLVAWGCGGNGSFKVGGLVEGDIMNKIAKQLLLKRSDIALPM